MKLYFLTAIIAIFSVPNTSYSQHFINNMGNCESEDHRLHYDLFNFISSNKNDTLEYTHMFSFYCGIVVEDLLDDNLKKQFFTPIHFITYDSVNYSLRSMFVHLIYSKRDSLNGRNQYIIELKIKGMNDPLAYVYGSDNVTASSEGSRITLAYLVSMDENDPYVASYSPQELTFISVYNQGGSYLFEIRDIDRQNMLVGLKYKSPTMQSEHIKFFVPNN